MGIYFRRKLPHYQPSEAIYFITFRLAGSLPQEAIIRLREERERELRAAGQDKSLSYRIRKKYFAKFDDLLEGKHDGPTWLADGRIAKVVAEALHYWDGKRYRLLCYCIMPNHVHMMIEVGQIGSLSYSGQEQAGNLSYRLSPILHSIKRYSARESNRILQRSGAFWQHESYDHVVRDRQELERIVAYVLNNPVKAGLAKSWDEWKWSYVSRNVFS